MSKVDIHQLLRELTLDEKIGQLIQLPGEFFKGDISTTTTGPSEKLGLDSNYNIYNTGSVLNVTKPNVMKQIQEKYLESARHKIPLLFMADIIYGYRTIFPIPLAQAGSFDFDAISEAASIVAEEAYNEGHHVTFSPMLDIVRDPRWGRVMESFGEDVFVGKNYAKSVVEGFQGKNGEVPAGKIAACLKHFAAYGAPIDGKDYGAVDMSMQQLYEVYLPAYKAALDAKCKCVMTSFNTINGVPATGDQWLMRDVLRKEYGFDGVLISDYAAIKELVDHGVAKDYAEAAKMALEAGVDIDMKTAVYSNNIKSLIEQGEMQESLLDEAVLRVLKLKEELGLFENPYRGLEKPIVAKSAEEKKNVALNLASKTTVLLKNKGVLPLNTNQKIALIGPHAKIKGQFGMWAFTGDVSLSVDLYTALKDETKEENIMFAEGSNFLLDYSRIGFSDSGGDFTKLFQVKDQQDLEEEALAIANQSDVIVLALGETVLESGEGASKTDLTLSAPQKSLLRKLKPLNKPIVGIFYTGRPLVLTDIEKDFDAILCAWMPGTYGNIANAKILMGEINPSGKLSMSFPKSVGQVPVFYSTYRSGRPIVSEGTAYRFTSRYLDETNAPLYPFGYGLSYTTFEITQIQATQKEFTNDTLPVISAKIKNTGVVAGEEVVQLYIRDDVATLSRPKCELKQTQRVSLEPGEEKVVQFQLTIEDLAFYNRKLEHSAEKGSFTISVASRSDKLEKSVTIVLK